MCKHLDWVSMKVIFILLSITIKHYCQLIIGSWLHCLRQLRLVSQEQSLFIEVCPGDPHWRGRETDSLRAWREEVNWAATLSGDRGLR